MQTKSVKKKEKPNVFNILYFCFIVLLPFVYSRDIIDPVLIPRQIYLTIFLSIISIVLTSKIISKKLIPDFKFLKKPLPLLFLAFILINIISFSNSIAITESLYVLSKGAIEVLFLLITIYLLIQKKLDLSIIIKSIIVFAAISVVLAYYQIISLMLSGQKLVDNVSFIVSTFANKNLLSSVLFLTLPFVVSSSLLSRNWRIASIVLFILSLLLLRVIHTRAILLAFILSFVVYNAFVLIKQQGGAAKLKYLYKIIIASAVVLAMHFAVSGYERYSTAPASIESSDQSTAPASVSTPNPTPAIVPISNSLTPQLTDTHTATIRFMLWDNSIQMIKEYPLLGVGVGNWQIHFPKYGLDKFDIDRVRNGLTTYQRPHNDFLWIFCETGLFGILIYLAIFAVVLIQLFLLYKRSDKSEDYNLYSAFIAGIIGYSFISFVDFPYERVEHQVLLYLIFAIGEAAYYHNKSKTKEVGKQPTVKLSAFVILAVASVTIINSFIVSLNRYNGEYHSQKLYGYHQTLNWERMIKEADKATNSYYSMDPMSAPMSWYKGVAIFTMGDIATAKTYFEQAYALHPYHLHILNNLASCYESLGDHQKAEQYYLKALSISSNFDEARLNLSAVYYNMKQYDKAFQTIDKCCVNSEDAKYKTFLPVILSSFVDLEIQKQKDVKMINKLTEIKGSQDKLMELYLNSKAKNITFEQYLITISH